MEIVEENLLLLGQYKDLVTREIYMIVASLYQEVILYLEAQEDMNIYRYQIFVLMYHDGSLLIPTFKFYIYFLLAVICVSISVL